MIAACNANNESMVSFWEDTWNLGVLKWKSSELYTYTLNKKILVQAFMHRNIENLLWLPH